MGEIREAARLRGKMIMIVRKHIYFSGRVQGVGFRYRARYAADARRLTGWVKNLWDDRVEMEVQGDPEDISLLIAELCRGQFISITDIEEEEIPANPRESSFKVIGY